MALTWSIDKVDNVEEITDNELEQLITEAIVFHTLGIGLGDITPSNWQEFYARVAFMENLDSPSLSVPKWVEVDAHELLPNQLIRFPDDDPDKLYYYHSTYYDGYEQSNVLEVRDYEYRNGFGPTKGEKPRVFVLNSASDWQQIQYHDGFEKRPITPQDVHRRIGLGTNVSNESRTAWTKRTMDRELDRLTKRAEAKLRDSEYVTY